MRLAHLSKLAGVVLVLAIPVNPLLAQEDISFECVSNGVSDDQGRIFVDSILDDGSPDSSGAIEGIVAVTRACFAAEGLAPAYEQSYIEGAVLTLVEAELRRRLVATGIDMSLADELVVILDDNPKIDLGAYIDARPDRYKVEIERVAAEIGMTTKDLAFLLGSSVGATSMLNAFKLQASEPE